jgi:hypothetical protein
VSKTPEGAASGVFLCAVFGADMERSMRKTIYALTRAALRKRRSASERQRSPAR